MFKKLSLALVALLFLAGSVMANDIITASDLDASGATEVANAVESSAVLAGDVADVDDSATEAVEACFRGWGGGCCYNYNYCYRPCYNYCYTPCYNYCYTPCYSYCYRPVCYSYTCYQPCFYSYWGCY